MHELYTRISKIRNSESILPNWVKKLLLGNIRQNHIQIFANNNHTLDVCTPLDLLNLYKKKSSKPKFTNYCTVIS